MFSSLALMIGGRFSRAKKRNKMVSFISLSSTIGIAVGVAVIIIGLSAMNGFERELQSRVLSVIPHGELEGVNGPLHNYTKTMNQALNHEHVVAAAPYVRFTGLAEKNIVNHFLNIRVGIIALQSRPFDSRMPLNHISNFPFKLAVQK